MKTKTLKLLGCALLSGLFAFVSQAQSVSSTPVGYVTQTIKAGTGTGRSFSTLALPLYSPETSGQVTSVSGSTITDDSASFGDLSTSSAPYAVKITSGSANGKYFTISSNTGTTLTLSGLSGVNSGDTFEVVAVDTLASLFGDPSDGVIVGGSKDDADIIWILDGSWSKYYHNGTNWVQDRRGSPVNNDLPLSPDSGMLISRLSDQASSFVITGTVPSGQSVVGVSSAGATLWSNTFPVDVELQDTGIQNIAGLTSDDTVYDISSGSWKKYFYDGTNWREQRRGNPISDDHIIASGSAILIIKASDSGVDGEVVTEPNYISTL
jgi:uncharacterized protein (TIGR02597 family)